MPQPRRYENQAQRQQAYRQRHAATRQAQLAARALPAKPVLPTKPGQRRWPALLGQARVMVEATAAELQEYYDDRSQQWQESDRGEAFLSRLEALQELAAAFDEVAEA